MVSIVRGTQFRNYWGTGFEAHNFSLSVPVVFLPPEPHIELIIH